MNLELSTHLAGAESRAARAVRRSQPHDPDNNASSNTTTTTTNNNNNNNATNNDNYRYY